MYEEAFLFQANENNALFVAKIVLTYLRPESLILLLVFVDGPLWFNKNVFTDSSEL